MAKVSAAEGLTPRPMDVGKVDEEDKESTGGIRLKKELGLMNGVGIIVGVMLGSGIFVSPHYALRYAGSKGMALIVWVLSGCLSMIGALCYAELGTMIPESGGDYAYIGNAFGSLLAFLYLWVALLIIVPTGNAITALIFASNILQPGWPACTPPAVAVQLVAALVTCILTVINCYNVKWVTKIQDYFTYAKVIALVVIFITSVIHLFQGHTENLSNMMENSNLEVGALSISFYTGLFSYSGWNFLNFVTEELKEPHKNLPRAILISMPVVTLIYTLTNVAFFAVLTNYDILDSQAVAVTYGDKILGSFNFVMPLFVALCTLGSLNGAIYASSRLFFVGARKGHLPMAISLIDVRRLTPVPSLIFMCITTLVMLLAPDVGELMVYATTVESIFIMCSVAGLLWLRYRDPNKERPIRVNLILPITFFGLCALLVIFSAIAKPMTIGVGFLLILLGVPVYYLFIYWQSKPKWFSNSCHSFNIVCAKLFLSLPEDSKEL